MAQCEIISSTTYADWNQFCRDVCVAHFLKHARKVGGTQVIVEIDETLMQKWKLPVEDRTAKTLLPIINEFISPGSIIYADKWKAYQSLSQNTLYKHLTVNHTINFVDPQTHCTTNHVESMWSSCKDKIKSTHGVNRNDLVDF
uniref:ISXO2-like transposase domain-containing protein n=1 Tax=Octopus bimaculoides TaxID=37653 RepID=A0A0L8IH82_OCTBM